MLRVLYHIGKDTKYIANKQECNRFFAPSRVEEDTAEERRNKETEKRYIYNKVWTNRENTQEHRHKKTNDAFGRNLPLRGKRDGSDEC